MKPKIMLKRTILILSLLPLVAIGAMGAKERIPYKNPTGEEFPILAWFSILGEENLTPERYRELYECGVNISFSHFTKTEDVEKALKACEGTNVKVLVTCSALKEQTQDIVRRFKQHPNLAGWHLRDEPITQDFADLGAFRDRIAAEDADHLIYMNLLPVQVPTESLGAKDYDDYAQRSIDEIGATQVSYDHYPIVRNGNRIVLVSENFFRNLEEIRRVSMRNGLPFWAFCLSTAHDPYPWATPVHLRVEAFNALAYGAQCIQYFTYWTPLGTHWNFHMAPITRYGTRTPVYYHMRDLNREIQALRHVFLGAKSIAVSHIGTNIPKSATVSDMKETPFTAITTNGTDAAIAILENHGKHYCMITNPDLDNAQCFSLTSPRTLRRIFPFTRPEKVKKGTHNYSVNPGDYLLFEF